MPFIYTLVDPRDNRVRYVGKSNDPEKRYQAHLYDRLNSNPRKQNWIKKLRRVGLKPILSVIEICAECEWQDRERYWISKFRETHSDLLNITDGGDAASDKARKAWGRAFVRSLSRRWNIKPLRCFSCGDLTVAHSGICQRCMDNLNDGGAWYDFYICDLEREKDRQRTIQKREVCAGLRLESKEDSWDFVEQVIKCLKNERLSDEQILLLRKPDTQKLAALQQACQRIWNKSA